MIVLIIYHYDQKITIPSIILKIYFIAEGFYLIFLFYFSYKFRNNIQKCFEDLDKDQQTLPPQQTASEQISKLISKQQIQVKKTSSEILPRFLSRLSSTYFQVINNSFNQKITANNNNNSNEDYIQKEDCSPKLPNRSNSFINQDFSTEPSLYSAKKLVLQEIISKEEETISVQNKIRTFSDQFEKQISTTLPNNKNEESLTQDHQLQQQCLICCANQANAVNLNCGHGGLCYDCAIEIMKKNNECYLCRAPIKEVLQLKKSQDSKETFEVVETAQLQIYLQA
eukprot:TRINITY_DN2879_c0_g1_i2.p1 TRINITY_DN2879_c0_g1~~TRINITY_DN2879_c0_g1_i2.p1  ORF type:complete len:283 (-),score=38.46 TRINITY_DN2879_c0_g1_i2:323-1171(-)